MLASPLLLILIREVSTTIDQETWTIAAKGVASQTFWHSARTILAPVLFGFLLCLFHLAIDEFRSELLDGPIEDEIELELALVVQLAEQAAQIGVVWRLVETQIATVRHVCGHLLWVPEAKCVNWCVDLALLDLLVLILFVTRA